MKTALTQMHLTHTVLALSLMAAFGSAWADDEEDALAALASPDSSVSLGIAATNGSAPDKALFGQYNAMGSGSAKLLLDVDINRRDDDTGIWTQLRGRNLGQDNREISGSYGKQGDWRISGGYDVITRVEPRTLNTGLNTANGTAPVVKALATVGSGTDMQLSTERKGLSLGGSKWITPALLFELDFKNETKDGTRLAARGIACGVFSHDYNVCGAAAGTGALLASTTGALLLVPEPISATTRQIDAKLSYASQGLKLHGGYYGSFYSNSNPAQSAVLGSNLLNPDGSVLNTALLPGSSLVGLLALPQSLSPNNEAHKLYLGGSYAFTPTTRANFKYALTRASQNAAFVGATLAGTPQSLGGAVNTTLAQVGLVARPVSKLTLLANLRYEDKDDQTPIASYFVAGGKNYSNTPSSSNKLNSKLEASYLLTDQYRATLGLDYQAVKRDRPVATALVDGLTGLREDTREAGYRAELRHSMSETLNASLSISRSRREGSNWLGLGAGFPALADSAIYNASGVFPSTLQDRQRDKLRLTADWTVSDALSIQMVADSGKDSYSAPTLLGMQDSDMRSVALDAVWKLSDQWKLTGFVSQSQQTLLLNHIATLTELANTAKSASIGIVGNPSSKYEVGATLSYLSDQNRSLQSSTSGVALMGNGLPDISYQVTSLTLFGKYAVQKNADIRIDLVHQNSYLGDWTWTHAGVPFAYSDNSSVTLQPNQNVSFVGVSYVYKMK
ncbi:MAG: MtrB/PioB family decaheme-associated outer membrane protein [Rhodoferax sp.]|nr:MtrB/PioB family decaheme-associated outer membrane protein [Rhodoferax sp.]